MKPITDTEARILQWAREHDHIAELGEFVGYDPDVGRVSEHWRAHRYVLALVEHMLASPAPASEPALAPQPAQAVPLSDEQVDKLAHDLWMSESYLPVRTFARVIERTHGIGVKLAGGGEGV